MSDSQQNHILTAPELAVNKELRASSRQADCSDCERRKSTLAKTLLIDIPQPQKRSLPAASAAPEQDGAQAAVCLGARSRANYGTSRFRRKKKKKKKLVPKKLLRVQSIGGKRRGSDLR